MSYPTHVNKETFPAYAGREAGGGLTERSGI